MGQGRGKEALRILGLRVLAHGFAYDASAVLGIGIAIRCLRERRRPPAGGPGPSP